MNIPPDRRLHAAIQNLRRIVIQQFDSAKDASNQCKHGVSLADATGFEWDEALA